MWQNELGSLRRLQTGLYSKSDAFFRESNEEVNPVVDKEFQRLIKTGEQLAEDRLKTNEHDIAAMYYLGMAKNTLAGYEATVKRTFSSALKNGTKGVKWHRKAVELDPTFIDAKLSIGLYKYILGSLPFYVKVLLFFSGTTGSKKEGTQLLEEVYTRGTNSQVEAGAVLMVLYERQKRFHDALTIADHLLSRYPQNYLFRLEKANLLSDVNQLQEGLSILKSLLQDPAAHAYMPDLLHFRYAEMLSKAGHWAEAFDHYQKAAEMPEAPDNLITMARLGAGKSLDAMHKRDQARAEYSIVLKRKEALDSHDQAKSYLKRPFKP
jgi:tetratricopeptide (TPR) repeat protein